MMAYFSEQEVHLCSERIFRMRAHLRSQQCLCQAAGLPPAMRQPLHISRGLHTVIAA